MLDSLQIKNFRCFEDLEIESLGRVNLIVGKNSVGKTTLLEAVEILACDKDEHTAKMASILARRDEVLNDLPVEFEKLLYRSASKTTKKGGGDTFCIGELEKPGKTINPKKDYIEYTLEPPFKSYSFVPSYIEEGKKLSKLWDEAYLNSDDSFIYDFLKILAPDITSLAFTGDIKRTCYIKTKSQGALPMKSFGEGTGRLLQIAFHSMMSKSGCLMIDGFENGLHYSIQEEVLKKLFELAENHNIQVFATTHSQDTVKSFCKAAIDSPEEGQLIALNRSDLPQDNNKIMAISYNEEELKVISRTGMEVR